MNEVINLIRCPSCEENFIEESHEFVCPECVPKVNADLAAYDVHKAVQEMDHQSIEQIVERLPILERAYEHLGAIIEIARKHK